MTMSRGRISSVFFAGGLVGVILCWACGNPVPPANAQGISCASYRVSFVVAATQGSFATTTVDDVELAAGQEPFAVVIVPGVVNPNVAVRTCVP